MPEPAGWILLSWRGGYRPLRWNLSASLCPAGRGFLCAQGGETPEFGQRVADHLVIVHRCASPERSRVGGLAERAAGVGLGVVDLGLFLGMNVADRNREMSRDGPGEDRRWLGVAEPGEHRGGTLERGAEPDPVAIAV
jgi:hypothetical protein